MEANEKIIVDTLVYTIAMFNRESFFDGRDMKELMPFVSRFLKNIGIYVCPCGANWCTEVRKETAENYIEENNKLFEEYREWYESQR